MAAGFDPFSAVEPYRPQLRQAAIGAASHPRVVLVREHPPIQFPALCPNCGASAARRVPIQQTRKFLIDGGESPNQTVHDIQTYMVAFCERCLTQHDDQRPHASPWLPLKRLLWGSGEALGGVIVIAIGSFVIPDAIRQMSLVPLIITAICWTTGGSLLLVNWRRNRYMTIQPATQVSAAIEFTPPLAADHEPSWRAFRFRDAAYAQAFRQLNAPNVWDPRGAEAQQARRQRRVIKKRNMWIFGVILVITALWALWDEYGGAITDLLQQTLGS